MTEPTYLLTEAQIEELRKVLPDNDWGQTLEDMLQSLPMVQNEPVGYANVDELDNLTSNGLIAIASEVSNWRKTKLYTSPQPLQPITADKLDELHHIEEFGLFCSFEEFEEIARAIEQKHGIVKHRSEAK